MSVNRIHFSPVRMDITFAFQRPGMDDDFNPEEFRPAYYQPDTELTLSPMILVGLFFVLLLLCGLCFGVGYSMGSRSAHNSPPTVQQPVAGAVAPATGSLPKRSAVPQKTHDAQSGVKELPAVSSSASAAAPQPRVTHALPDTASVLMVQIAVVSSQEDADVLVGALSKRGYTATARRDPADSKLHVRIGPFRNRNEANAMRKKLIYDGYNAVVQP